MVMFKWYLQISSVFFKLKTIDLCCIWQSHTWASVGAHVFCGDLDVNPEGPALAAGSGSSTHLII